MTHWKEASHTGITALPNPQFVTFPASIINNSSVLVIILTVIINLTGLISVHVCTVFPHTHKHTNTHFRLSISI